MPHRLLESQPFGGVGNNNAGQLGKKNQDITFFFQNSTRTIYAKVLSVPSAFDLVPIDLTLVGVDSDEFQYDPVGV